MYVPSRVAVDGVWREWNDWFACNVSCGGGSQMSTRDCTSPKYGGSGCVGDDRRWQNCSDNPCPSRDFLSHMYW